LKSIQTTQVAAAVVAVTQRRIQQLVIARIHSLNLRNSWCKIFVLTIAVVMEDVSMQHVFAITTLYQVIVQL